MKALRNEAHGGAEVLSYSDLPLPKRKAGGIRLFKETRPGANAMLVPPVERIQVGTTRMTTTLFWSGDELPLMDMVQRVVEGFALRENLDVFGKVVNEAAE